MTEAGVKFELNDGAMVGTATIFQVEQENISTVDDNFKIMEKDENFLIVGAT